MINISILALFFAVSLPSYATDTDAAISRVEQAMKTELGLSFATFSYLVRWSGSSETMYSDTWHFDDLDPKARELEAKSYLRIVVFEGEYQDRKLHLVVFRPTEESLPILAQASEVEWNLAKTVQPPSYFENVRIVYDSISSQ